MFTHSERTNGPPQLASSASNIARSGSARLANSSNLRAIQSRHSADGIGSAYADENQGLVGWADRVDSNSGSLVSTGSVAAQHIADVGPPSEAATSFERVGLSCRVSDVTKGTGKDLKKFKRIELLRGRVEDVSASVLETIDNIEYVDKTDKRVRAYFDNNVYLEITPTQAWYRKRLHYPLPHRFTASAWAAGFRPWGDLEQAGVENNFWEAVINDVSDYDPEKRLIIFSNGTVESVYKKLTTPETFRSTWKLRALKDTQTLMFAGTKFKSWPAKIIGLGVSAVVSGGPFNMLANFASDAINEARFGTTFPKLNENGSLVPQDIEEKRAIAGFIAKSVGQILFVIRNEFIRKGQDKLGLIAQFASNVISGLINAVMSYAFAMATAIDAFGITLGFGFVPFIFNTIYALKIYPMFEREFMSGRKLSPSIKNLITWISNNIFFRTIKALLLVFSEAKWDMKKVLYGLGDKLHGQVTLQVAQQTASCLFTEIGNDAADYTTEAAGIRNYYDGELDRNNLPRYDQIYQRGFDFLEMPKFRLRELPNRSNLNRRGFNFLEMPRFRLRELPSRPNIEQPEQVPLSDNSNVVSV